MSVKCGVALLLVACFAGFFAVSSAQGDRCEQGWRYYGDSCYFREANAKKRKTWQAAQTQCETMQANLVTVNNKDEMEFLKSILGKFESWCGLNNREYVWQSGEESNYTNWSQGQPKWRCAYVMSRKKAYKWQTAKCSAKYRYTCEKDAVPLPSPCSSNPCENGGTCIEEGDSYRCQCPGQFTGPQCETVVDPCDSSPCMNGGTCTSTGDKFSCACTDQFTGDRCETRPSCNNTIKTVSPPVTHSTRSITQGAWMKDPTGVMGNETIFVMPSYTGKNVVEEFENLEKLNDNVARKTYQLPYNWDGTGAVVYGQYLYYNRENSRYIIKYNLRTERDEAQLELSSYVPRQVTYQWGGYSGVDLAVDEQGLWVLWGVTANGNRLTLGKIDVNRFVITQTWPLNTESMSAMGNAFVACGVVYCIDSYNRNPTTINFAYDTKTGKQWNPNIQFTNQYGYNSMVDYNPREKVLYSWDSRRLVTYPTDAGGPPPSPCSSNPCENGGTCIEEGDSYRCQCPGQFTGPQCKTGPSCNNTIKTVSAPVTHGTRSITQGAWMKDPTGVMGNETIFVMPSWTGKSVVEEFENLEKLNDDVARKTYQLPYNWDGTGAVVYRQYLYFNRENSRYIIKYNLRTERDEAQLELSSYVPRQVAYQWGGASGVDLAVDEQGLWVLWGVVENDRRLTLGKIDVNKFVITQTWPLNTESMNTMGNAFVACGVVYCVDSYNANPTTINFAYDTKTGKQWNPNIQFINQYGYNSMVDYNPREKVLYSWDSKHLVTYLTDAGGPCFSNPCENGGICIQEGDSYRCQCPGLFTGPQCKTETGPSCNNTIKTVSAPVTHSTRSITQGAWIKDPTGIMGNETIFVMPSYTGKNVVEEFENLEKLNDDVARKTYQLPYNWDGTGAVVYGQFLYYNRENSRYIIKYNLRTERDEAQLGLNSYVPRQVTYQWGGYSGVDLAVDELGLWVLWGVTANGNRLTLGKIDINKFVITQTWPLNTESMNTMGNAFVACGVVYCIDSYNGNPSTINFAYDTKTGKQWNPNIQFTNQYGYNSMVDYNPREKVLYSWDLRRLVTYSQTFE